MLKYYHDLDQVNQKMFNLNKRYKMNADEIKELTTEELKMKYAELMTKKINIRQRKINEAAELILSEKKLKLLEPTSK